MIRQRQLNLQGFLFGSLEVVRIANRSASNVNWLCRCECGNEIAVKGSSLRSGNTRSCGCRKRRIAQQHERQFYLFNHPARSCWQVLQGSKFLATFNSVAEAKQFIAKGIIASDMSSENAVIMAYKADFRPSQIVEFLAMDLHSVRSVLISHQLICTQESQLYQSGYTIQEIAERPEESEDAVRYNLPTFAK